jgi:hypothetical protein
VTASQQIGGHDAGNTGTDDCDLEIGFVYHSLT